MQSIAGAVRRIEPRINAVGQTGVAEIAGVLGAFAGNYAAKYTSVSKTVSATLDKVRRILYTDYNT